MKRKPKTLVIIPAFNEEERILAVIKGVHRYLPEADILVIDDGSSDRTAQVSRQGGAIVVRHPINLGVGTALQTGYKFAARRSFDYLIQLDADGQHDPISLPNFLNVLRSTDAELVIGSRFLQDGDYRGSLPRKIGIRFFARLLSVLIGERISDPTSGYRGMKRSLLRFCTLDVYSFDYPDADFLLTLHRAGFHIVEIPIEIKMRMGGYSQHRGLRPVYYFAKMMLSIFITLLRKKSASR
jgi:glycosyltransferase involved in cell wall biosynthesis